MLPQITSIFQVLIEPRLPASGAQLQLRPAAESYFEIVPSFAPINYGRAVRLKRYCPIIALKSHALPLTSARLINAALCSGGEHIPKCGVSIGKILRTLRKTSTLIQLSINCNVNISKLYCTVDKFVSKNVVKRRWSLGFYK